MVAREEKLSLRIPEGAIAQAALPVFIDPLLASAAWSTDVMNQNAAAYGLSVSGAGDLNGDGYDDVIIGAPNYDETAANEGKVFVFHGASTGLPTTPSWSITPNGHQANEAFGTVAGAVGDVNGDGYGDILVTSPNWDNIVTSTTDQGRIYAYYGSASGLPAVPSWVVHNGTESNTWLGLAAAALGDVNGDGYADIAVGVPGKDVAAAGDVNGDGYADLIVGSPSFDPATSP